jgi:hypothetical protein
MTIAIVSSVTNNPNPGWVACGVVVSPLGVVLLSVVEATVAVGGAVGVAVLAVPLVGVGVASSEAV